MYILTSLSHQHNICYFCRPQTKFAKVMFLHVSVILSTGGVPGQVPPRTRYTPLGSGTPPGRYTPPQARYPPGRVNPPGRFPPDQVPPRPCTPRAGTSPLDQVHIPRPCTLPGQVHPPDRVHPPVPVHAGRYGKQVGSTHPTGMHSCRNYFCNLFYRK